MGRNAAKPVAGPTEIQKNNFSSDCKYFCYSFVKLKQSFYLCVLNSILKRLIHFSYIIHLNIYVYEKILYTFINGSDASLLISGSMLHRG